VCGRWSGIYGSVQCSKYSRNVLIDLMTTGKIKNMIWDNFLRTVSL